MTTDEKINEIEYRLKTEARIIYQGDYHETYHLECATEVKIEGMWLEFGVYTGRSLEQLSRKCPHDIFGFDCFEGLPETWDANNPKGCYGLGGEIPAGYIIGENHSMFNSNHPHNIASWPFNVKLVKGYFDSTLPKFLEKYTDNAAFIHIDSDLYSSAKTILDNLKPRIIKGTIIAFDEIVGYEAYRQHEIKAFAEFLLENKLDYEPILGQYLDNYGQGCFRIK